MVRITELQDTAVYGTLPAYADYPVLLPTSELQLKRGRRIADLLRVGQLVPCATVRVEGEHVDVSLKQCRPEEAATLTQTYHADLHTDQLVRTAAKLDPARMEALYTTVIWPLRASRTEPLSDLWEATRIAMDDGTPTDPALPEDLCAAIRVRMPSKTYTAERTVPLRFGLYPDGVQRLQAALCALASQEGISVYVVAAPNYKIVASDRTPARAAARLAATLTTCPAPC